MTEVIRSSDNSIVKKIRKVHNRKKGDELVYIEGLRIVEDCLLSGGVCDRLICSEKKFDAAYELAARYGIPASIISVIDDSLFDRISSTVNSQGIAMLVKVPQYSGSLIENKDKAVYCILDCVQDPGNVGTIIRMSDAFGFDAVIVTEGTADPFGEKALRASMGSTWHIPIVSYGNDVELVNDLNSKGITTLGMHLKGNNLDTAELSLPCAFIIGNEGKGMSDEVSSVCSSLVKIPMPGKAESLNAASAASIIGNELRKARDLTL